MPVPGENTIELFVCIAAGTKKAPPSAYRICLDSCLLTFVMQVLHFELQCIFLCESRSKPYLNTVQRAPRAKNVLKPERLPVQLALPVGREAGAKVAHRKTNQTALFHPRAKQTDIGFSSRSQRGECVAGCYLARSRGPVARAWHSLPPNFEALYAPEGNSVLLVGDRAGRRRNERTAAGDSSGVGIHGC